MASESPAELIQKECNDVFHPSLIPVDDSAILDCQFSDFYHTAPQGFEKILFEQQIFWRSASASTRVQAHLWISLRPLWH